MAHIVIIEPDTLLAHTYATALEHAGYTVAVAYGGQEAIYAADTRTPDAVVMELQLARQDGIGFLHEFRSYAEWRAVPVIVQSTVTPQAIAPLREALQRELGVVAFLYKPATSLKQLIRTLRETVPVTKSAEGREGRA